MALIGSVAAGPVGGAGGLMAGLIFDLTSKVIETTAGPLEESIAKIRIPSHLINIFDFKRKYDI